MIHNTRRFAVKEYPSFEELAEAITRHDWTPCTGMKTGKLLFLNDAFSGGMAEYAVVVELEGTLMQIESLTVGWMTPEAFVAQAHKMERDVELGTLVMRTPVNVKLEEYQVHSRCHLCA